MLLYGTPGGCSQASHIALHEAGLTHRFVIVGRDKQTEDGQSFGSISPKGYTPALQLDDGAVLTESLAILGYIAERSDTLAPAGSLNRWRVLETLEFMTTEVHGAFRPLFQPDAPETQRESAGRTLAQRFATLDTQLGDKPFLFGAHMSIADPYLFVMLAWADMMKVAVTDGLAALSRRMRETASVRKALAAERLG